MPKNKKATGSTQHELVQCNIEYIGFQNELKELEPPHYDQVFNCIEKIEKMTWAQIYATSSKGAGKRGLNWEVLTHQKTASGGTIATIRVSEKFRARVTRNGVTMIFISLHPDHDSAYKGHGGEDI